MSKGPQKRGKRKAPPDDDVHIKNISETTEAENKERRKIKELEEQLENPNLTKEQIEELKYQLKLAKNREAALHFRQRQKDYLEQLQDETQQLEDTVDEKTKVYNDLASKNQQLRQELSNVRDFIGKALAFPYTQQGNSANGNQNPLASLGASPLLLTNDAQKQVQQEHQPEHTQHYSNINQPNLIESPDSPHGPLSPSSDPTFSNFNTNGMDPTFTSEYNHHDTINQNNYSDNVQNNNNNQDLFNHDLPMYLQNSALENPSIKPEPSNDENQIFFPPIKEEHSDPSPPFLENLSINDEEFKTLLEGQNFM